jgi:hypothetical protein
VSTRKSVVAAAARVIARPRAHGATVTLPLALTLLWLSPGVVGPQDAPAAPPRCPQQSAPRDVPAAAIEACLEQGGRVDLQDKTIRGDLDLRGVQDVERPLACRRCRFGGDVDASEVVFRRAVDLTGSRVRGALNMRGAFFHGAALFSSAGSGATFQGAADFTLAVFTDILSFEEATFGRPARFVSARFLNTASFSLATFLADVSFDGAAFAGDASFGATRAEDDDTARVGAGACAEAGSTRGAFERRASFVRTAFRRGADFRQRCFGRRARFAQTNFGERAEFTQAAFLGDATFADARLQDGATFRAAVFAKAASFEDATSGGTLDFDVASFLGRADFFGLVSESALVLDDADFEQQIEMEELSAASLLLEVEAADRVAGVEKRRVLQLIESAAKARGDLDRANDAHYERLSLESEKYGPVRRFWDVVFYRGFAGYLVRPAHPLIALAVLAFLAALIRRVLVLRSRDSENVSSHELPGWWRTKSGLRWMVLAWRRFREFVHEYWRTIRRTVRDKQESEPDPQPLFLEVAVYRVLFVVAIIGLANSNPTLRQMVDAAF